MLHREDRRRWSDAELLSAIAARDGAAFRRLLSTPPAGRAGVLVAPDRALGALHHRHDEQRVVGYQQLYQTSDSGAHWTPVGPKGLNWV